MSPTRKILTNKLLEELVLISLLIIIFLGSFSISVICEETEEEYLLELDMAIYIHKVIIENNTAILEVNLWIRNFPQEADNIKIKFQGMDYPEIICSHMGGNQFQGKLEKKAWYVEGVGELFPFDYYQIKFILLPYHLTYEKNGTSYGLINWNYTFVEDRTTVHFVGLYRLKLENMWNLNNLSRKGEYYIFLFRKGEIPSFQYIWPLIMIQCLIFFIPTLTSFTEKNRSIRIRIYASIMVFSPILVFTMQNFIPYRETYSIPEFLAISMIISSIIMILVSAPNFDGYVKKKYLMYVYFILDITGILISWSFYNVFKNAVYKDIRKLLLLQKIHDIFKFVNWILLLSLIIRFLVLGSRINRFKNVFKEYFKKYIK